MMETTEQAFFSNLTERYFCLQEGQGKPPLIFLSAIGIFELGGWIVLNVIEEEKV
jgi:hypothetical protein